MTHQQAVDKQSAERYLLDEMPEIERFAFEEHLFDCDICADDVRTGALMREGVEAGFLGDEAEGKSSQTGGSKVEPADPGIAAAAVAAARRHQTEPQVAPAAKGGGWRVVLPWAVAASLALAAAYQSFWVVPGLRSEVLGPTVLSPVTLRGASRGAEPTLTRPAAGVISLAVDLAGVPAGSRLTYDLRAADGVSVASGTAAAPPPGTPLLLLIPASSLDSSGGYVLAVVSGDGPDSTDYRFTIESEK